MKFTTVFSVALLAGFTAALPVDTRLNNVQRAVLDLDDRDVDSSLFRRAKVKTPPKTTPKSTPTPTTKKADPTTTKKADPTTTSKKEDPTSSSKKENPSSSSKEAAPSSKKSESAAPSAAPSSKSAAPSASGSGSAAPSGPSASASRSASPSGSAAPSGSSSAAPSASACPMKRADNGGNTNNDCNDGSITLKTPDNKEVKLKLGTKVGFGGTNGKVYDVNCGTDANCKAMGTVVVKEYNADGQFQAPEERKGLQKINELKASGNSGGKEYTVMVKHDGVYLSKTTALTSTKANSEERKKVIADAVKLASDDGAEYINKFGVRHKDNHNQNVLFQESGGKLSAAKLIDWDDFEEVTDKAGAIETLKKELEEAFNLLLED